MGLKHPQVRTVCPVQVSYRSERKLWGALVESHFLCLRSNLCRRRCAWAIWWVAWAGWGRHRRLVGWPPRLPLRIRLRQDFFTFENFASPTMTRPWCRELCKRAGSLRLAEIFRTILFIMLPPSYSFISEAGTGTRSLRISTFWLFRQPAINKAIKNDRILILFTDWMISEFYKNPEAYILY